MSRRRLSMLLVFVIALSSAWFWARGAGRGAPSTLERLPRDPLAAGVFVLDDPLVTFDYWLDLLAKLTDEGREEIDKEIAKLDEELGFSLRDDLVAQLGPEIGFSADLDSLDEIAGAAMGGGETLARFMQKLVLIVEVRDAEKIERVARTLAAKAGAELSTEDDWVKLRFGGADAADGVEVYYRITDELFVAGFAAATVTATVEGLPRGERLTDGDDFARVQAHLHPSPDTLTYVNLPRLRALLEESGMLQGWVMTTPRGRDWLDVLTGDEWMGIGLGSSTAETDGGLETLEFGPTMTSRLRPHRWLSQSWASPGLFSAVGLFGQMLEQAGTKPGATEARQTMATIRTVATACEEHAIDQGRYPGPTGGWVPVGSIAAELQPTYLRQLPQVDGWGHEILYWSDGEHYRLASPGADGEQQQDWLGSDEGRATDDPARDIVLGDGAFLSWYEAR